MDRVEKLNKELSHWQASYEEISQDSQMYYDTMLSCKYKCNELVAKILQSQGRVYTSVRLLDLNSMPPNQLDDEICT
jgi:hypothetical protein